MSRCSAQLHSAVNVNLLASLPLAARTLAATWHLRITPSKRRRPGKRSPGLFLATSQPRSWILDRGRHWQLIRLESDSDETLATGRLRNSSNISEDNFHKFFFFTFISNEWLNMSQHHSACEMNCMWVTYKNMKVPAPEVCIVCRGIIPVPLREEIHRNKAPVRANILAC